MSFDNVIAWGYFIFQAVIRSYAGALGQLFQLFVQVTVVIVVERRGVLDAGIYFFSAIQVFVKGVEKIKMIISSKIQLSEIAVYKEYIFQL